MHSTDTGSSIEKFTSRDNPMRIPCLRVALCDLTEALDGFVVGTLVGLDQLFTCTSTVKRPTVSESSLEAMIPSRFYIVDE